MWPFQFPHLYTLLQLRTGILNYKFKKYEAATHFIIYKQLNLECSKFNINYVYVLSVNQFQYQNLKAIIESNQGTEPRITKRNKVTEASARGM